MLQVIFIFSNWILRKQIYCKMNFIKPQHGKTKGGGGGEKIQKFKGSIIFFILIFLLLPIIVNWHCFYSLV